MAYSPRPALGQATMANSEPVVIASDQSAILVDLGANNDVTVTGTVTANLAAGTNNIGDVDILSIAAGDNNIGNVDVVTLPAIPAGTNNIGDVDVLTINGVAPAFGTGLREATVQRVTIATDDSVPITNAGITTLAGAVAGTEMQVDVLTMPTVAVTGTFWQATQPVSLTSTTITGTVAVTQSGTWDEVGINDSGNSITIDAPVGTPAFVRLSDGASAITTLPVSLASVPSHAVTNAGTFVVQENGAALTALQIMDDWDNGASDGASVSGDVAHDTIDAGEPVKIGMKAYELDGTAPQTAVAEADRVNAISDLVGRQYVATEHPRFWHASVDYASAQTNATIKASPGASLALYITDIMISNGATAGNITLLDGSGGTVLFEIYPAVNGGVALNLKNPIKLTDATLLAITSTTVTTHSVFVSGFID